MFVLILLHNQSIFTRKIVKSKSVKKSGKSQCLFCYYYITKVFWREKSTNQITKNYYILGTSTCGTDQGLRDTCPQVWRVQQRRSRIQCQNPCCDFCDYGNSMRIELEQSFGVSNFSLVERLCSFGTSIQNFGCGTSVLGPHLQIGPTSRGNFATSQLCFDANSFFAKAKSSRFALHSRILEFGRCGKLQK